MKSVLISIRPKWCEKIANGEKTIEVRKTRPKLETPFKCYIYCTLSGSNELFRDVLHGDVARWNRENWGFRKGHVIGEFVCDEICTYFYDTDCGEWAEPNAWMYYITTGEGEKTCLSYDEFAAYGKGKTIYGWHISNLKIYDTPKELSEFGLTRAPQSWCYVKGGEGA